ncbi:hypothetical protein O0I10_008116 [Lichtheimia ornata]|uniref:chitin synthase n=1 Tax=Lichtheimia ornata TaxID=688661 RepID=A0AAD7UYP4_9FUNG|nr:uncharacterized protein O0I10_008116 [Lichtheimia ornata]KAJ8656103.1 hypothetical protein O0I10_008116 [Lichtheimia ornata]
MPTLTCRRILWVIFARLCTLFIPNLLLLHIGGLSTAASRQAWREKVAICFLFVGITGLFLFWIEYISTLFCDVDHYIPATHVFRNDSRYVAINGQAFEFAKYLDASPPTNQIAAQATKYAGHDMSPMFPSFMMLDRHGRPSYSDNRLEACINQAGRTAQADAWLAYTLSHDSGYKASPTGELITCPIPNNTLNTGAPCYPGVDRHVLPLKGDIVYDLPTINNFTSLPYQDEPGKAFVVLDNKVLDVTMYLNGATNIIEMSSNIYSRAFALDRMFLPLDVTMMLFINVGTDITDNFRANITNAALYEECVKMLFFHGVTDDEAEPTGCKNINPALWATMGAGLLYFLLKMNLAHLCRLRFMQRFLFSSTDILSPGQQQRQPHTVLLVPCYSEPSDIIRQTLESLARTNYDDTKKLLLFVCDGVTRSRYDSKDTHQCVLELLGYSGTIDPIPQPYVSLGQHHRRVNYAKVFSGFYETGRNRVPYLVIVKTGNTREHDHAGNRGKRDTMVLVMSFLERCMNLANNRMAPLEYELFNQCYSVLGIDPRAFKYMLVIDADMQVQSDLVQKLVSRLEKDRRMLAISGHVRPANPEQNIITMLQIFPLYLTSYSGLAYEAFLGTVLSINGGLTMYKLWTENVPDDVSERDTSQHRRRGHRWRFWWRQRSRSISTSQHTLDAVTKWPKVSDEINPANDPWDIQQQHTMNGSQSSLLTGHESRLSLSPNTGIRPCCIHPTVLRGFAAARADTLHMENVLLLGEEQYLGVVLLRSHPKHRLGFEPEAVGYVTLPTHITALQALQSRNMRTTLHNQLEMQRVSWSLGFGCWVVSITKLFDMLLSFPIILYLYSVYIRFFMQVGRVYTIIAFSFTCLVVLHILYFIVRRQFKYVLWFIIYGLFSVPFFAIWFPIVAVWCSDYAERWYDVWPTTSKHRGRSHGIVDHPADNEDDDATSEHKVENTQDVVPRMRLGEYEAVEAEKAYQRAKEEAAALDSKFTGFTGFVSGRAGSIHSMASTPLNDDNNSNNTLRVKKNAPSATTMRAGSLGNPFASPLDNPFDDGYAVYSTHTRHKPSQSQSSYPTWSSRASNDDYFVPPPLPPTAAAMATIPHDTATHVASDRRSIRSTTSNAISLADSNLSLDPEISLETARHDMLSPPHGFDEGGGSSSSSSSPQPPDEEGRTAALHGRVGLKIPGHGISGYNGTSPPAPSTLHHPSSKSIRRRKATPPEPSQQSKDVLLPVATATATAMQDNNSIEAIEQEIRVFLQDADLDSITRAQVKQHLYSVFGELQDEELVHKCIEDITLEFLTRQSSVNPD